MFICFRDAERRKDEKDKEGKEKKEEKKDEKKDEQAKEKSEKKWKDLYASSFIVPSYYQYIHVLKMGINLSNCQIFGSISYAYKTLIAILSISYISIFQDNWVELAVMSHEN